MIQTSRTLIESADVIYSKLTQAQRAGLWGERLIRCFNGHFWWTYGILKPAHKNTALLSLFYFAWHDKLSCCSYFCDIQSAGDATSSVSHCWIVFMSVGKKKKKEKLPVILTKACMNKDRGWVGPNTDIERFGHSRMRGGGAAKLILCGVFWKGNWCNKSDFCFCTYFLPSAALLWSSPGRRSTLNTDSFILQHSNSRF